MRGVEREHDAKRLRFFAILDHADGFIDKQICRVTFFFNLLSVALPIGAFASSFAGATDGVVEVVDRRTHESIEVIEAALNWVRFFVKRPQVPFTNQAGMVTGRLKHRWQQPFFYWQPNFT